MPIHALHVRTDTSLPVMAMGLVTSLALLLSLAIKTPLTASHVPMHVVHAACQCWMFNALTASQLIQSSITWMTTPARTLALMVDIKLLMLASINVWLVHPIAIHVWIMLISVLVVDYLEGWQVICIQIRNAMWPVRLILLLIYLPMPASIAIHLVMAVRRVKSTV